MRAGAPLPKPGALPAQRPVAPGQQPIPFYGPTGSGGSSFPLGISGPPPTGGTGSGVTNTYEVVYKVVALRSGPSIESKPLGRLDCGNRVRGTLHRYGKEPWLRLVEQKLPPLTGVAAKSALREVGPEEEVWVLVDASNSGLGLGALLQKVDDVEEIDPRDMTQWKVVHNKVAYRKEASITATAIGYFERGHRLEGVVRTVGAIPWLMSFQKDAQGQKRPIWMLIDGSAFGLDRLLKEVYNDSDSSSEEEEEQRSAEKAAATNGNAKAAAKAAAKAKAAEAKAKAKAAEPKAEAVEPKAKAAESQVAKPKAVAAELDGSPKAKAEADDDTKARSDAPAKAPSDGGPVSKAKAKAKAKQGAKSKAKQLELHELGDLSKWIYHDHGQLGRYKVMHQQVVIRNMPSVKAKMKGIVTKGDFVQGERRDEWLLMDWEVNSLDLLDGNGRWLLIDGKSVGFGMLLERVGEIALGGSSNYQKGPDGQAEGEAQPKEQLPRVLCLPGAASGKDILNWQLSFLVRRAKGILDLIFIEGPRDCNDPEAVKIMSGFFRGKPMKMLDEIAFDDRNWLSYKQPRSALQWLQQQLQEHAPVHAVLGFSQGADFAAMLAAQASCNVGLPLSCVVLLCPHAPGYARHVDEFFKNDIKVPAFILRGEQEDYDEGMKETLKGKVIDKKGFKMPSEHVARLFREAEVVTHRDGHRPMPEERQEAEKITERMFAFVCRNAKSRPLGQVSKPQAEMELREGMSVRLVGLEKVAHLNKQEGTLQRYDGETERWVVTLLNSGEQAMLREKNLEIVDNICVKCEKQVGFRKGESGERYCPRCWPTVACDVCKREVGTEKDDVGRLYCGKCWAKRMCVKCKTVLGDTFSPDGDRYCKACWAEVSCSDCRKELGTKSYKDRSFCKACWLAMVCVRCDQEPGTIQDEGKGHRFCQACWELTACIACNKRLGDVRDVRGDNYCSRCWDGLRCVICLKAVGSVKDSNGDQHCQSCWEKYRLCLRCKTEVGTVKEDDKQYCAQCHYILSLCIWCEATPGEPRTTEGFRRFCHACWAVHERERLLQAQREQTQLFRDLLGACEQMPGPPVLAARPGAPELPREAGAFLQRFKLGPVDGDIPAPEASLPPTPLPQSSPVQGTCHLESGRGWSLEFTSAFDGGNASVDSWAVEQAKAGVPTFCTRVAPDFKVNSASLRAFDQARQYWFFFGVTPVDPMMASGARFRLKVGGMMRQEDLFDNGYAPLCHSPSMPMWRRVEEGSVECKREKDDNGESKNTMVISWLHTIAAGDVGGTTYFAFCYPFSFADLQACLSRMEHAAANSLWAGGEGQAVEELPLLGCLHQLHAGCTYFPFGQHALEPPRVGTGIYFHRQLFARSPQGRTIEMLTITEAPENLTEAEDWPRDELPEPVQRGLRGWPSSPPLVFQDRPICFASGRVHPGETPGQFAFLGLLQFLLSDDPRAALLRKRFVFKLIPMMNPDGVAWGHSRTNSLGFDLNRCYAQPTPEEHDVVFSVKVQLIRWKEHGSLCWYTDMHAHGKDRGCFLYGNLQESDQDFCKSVAYGHVVQMNCPHVDIDKCLWSTAPAPKADQPDYDSGRGQIGRCCKLPLAYTLECNYNTGRLCRPVADPPSLAPQFVGTQTVRESGVPRDPAAGGRFSPVTYDPCSWAAVGEALAVSVLDIQADNPFSRLLVGRPPKLIAEVGGRTSLERAHQPDVLRRLDEFWEMLARRHRVAGQSFRLTAAV